MLQAVKNNEQYRWYIKWTPEYKSLCKLYYEGKGRHPREGKPMQAVPHLRVLQGGKTSPPGAGRASGYAPHPGYQPQQQMPGNIVVANAVGGQPSQGQPQPSDDAPLTVEDERRGKGACVVELEDMD